MQKIMLNHKGVTVVELIVTFALVMVIVVGMLNVITQLKDTAGERILQKELLEYNGTLTQVIQDDLIRKKAKSINVCPTSQEQKPCYIITFEDNSTKQIIVNMISDAENKKYIAYDEIIYPLPQQSLMEFRDSSVLYSPDNSEDEINNVKINIDANNFLHIYIPFFIVDEPTNYGINIVYPIGL